MTRPIRLRTTVTPDSQTTAPIVNCPQRNELIDAQRCASCMRMVALEWQADGGEVRCLLSNQTPSSIDPRADFGERAARTTVNEIAGRVVTCVKPDVPLARIREVFAKTRERAVAVVDNEGKLEALISRSDLVRAPEEGTAADVMTACVHALPEDAPLSYAVSLLAHDDVSQVPIVSRDGTVTGICHALDLLRWFANGLGYTVTKR